MSSKGRPTITAKNRAEAIRKAKRRYPGYVIRKAKMLRGTWVFDLYLSKRRKKKK